MVVRIWVQLVRLIFDAGTPFVANNVKHLGLAGTRYMHRVGQNHIYTLYVRYYRQGNNQIYGHIRCIYIGF